MARISKTNYEKLIKELDQNYSHFGINKITSNYFIKEIEIEIELFLIDFYKNEEKIRKIFKDIEAKYNIVFYIENIEYDKDYYKINNAYVNVKLFKKNEK